MTVKGTPITHLPRSGRTEKDGFTLIELLVVMIIVALMAAMTTPLLTGSLGSVTLRSGAKQIAASLRFARQQSIMRQAPYAVVLHPDSNTVAVAPVGSDENSLAAQDVNSEFRLNEKIAVEPAAGLAPGEDGAIAVTFYDDGSSSGGRILVRDQKDRRLLIDIDLVTGIVSVDDG